MKGRNNLICFSFEHGRREYSFDGDIAPFWRDVGHGRITPHNLDGPAIIDEYGGEYFFIAGVPYTNKSLYDDNATTLKNMPLELRLTDPCWWVRELHSNFKG